MAEAVVRTVCTVLADQGICFIADAGLDDQKFFEYCGAQQVEFIIRAAHDRWVEVFNERLSRWEREHLKDLVDSVASYKRLARNEPRG